MDNQLPWLSASAVTHFRAFQSLFGLCYYQVTEPFSSHQYLDDFFPEAPASLPLLCLPQSWKWPQGSTGIRTVAW